MNSAEHEELIKEIAKLNRYCTQYMSREMTIHQALGYRGSKYLSNIFELALKTKEDKQ